MQVLQAFVQHGLYFHTGISLLYLRRRRILGWWLAARVSKLLMHMMMSMSYPIIDFDIFVIQYFRGLWGANAINHAVYDNLSTNIPTALMEDWSLSFTNDNQSRFVSKDALSNYLQRLSESFDLRAYTRFNTRVTKVTPIDRKPSDMGAWTVQYTTAGTNEGLCKTSTEVFDCVAVATGHYNVPYMPSLPGQEEWLSGGDDVTPRKIMHAMQYRNPSNFSGRSVLVVGMRSSGTDISREISSVVSQLYALDKRCKQVERDGHCIHVPRHCRLREDGRLELPGGGGVIPGKPIDTIVLATGTREQVQHALDAVLSAIQSVIF